ncbi:MAG: VanZ family protein [Clostridia bacterium]|nr:VanZ family protein [Clostridia bacterium]
MKKNIIRIILLILLAVTFVIIFGFSNQGGKETSGVSKKVSRIIIEIFNKNASIEKKEQMIKTINPVIRKLAHISIYTVVGMLLMSFVYTYEMKEKTRVNTSVIIGFIYACSDEIHQSFIPGRNASFIDALIDTFGVVLGVIIIAICMKCIKYIKDRKYVKSIL